MRQHISLHCGGCSPSGIVPVTKLGIDGSGNPIEPLEGHPCHSTRLIDLILIQCSLQNSSFIQHAAHSYYIRKKHATSAAALATMWTVQNLFISTRAHLT